MKDWDASPELSSTSQSLCQTVSFPPEGKIIQWLLEFNDIIIMLGQHCKLTKGTKVWYLNGVKWGGNKLCLIISVKNNTKIAAKIYTPTCSGTISSVCECALHTLLLHSTYMNLSIIVKVLHAARICYRLCYYFRLGDKRKTEINWKRKWDSCCNQSCYVFTLPDCLSVTYRLSLLPVSVPMTLLLTRAGDPSFIRPNYILWPLAEMLQNNQGPPPPTL